MKPTLNVVVFTFRNTQMYFYTLYFKSINMKTSKNEDPLARDTFTKIQYFHVVIVLNQIIKYYSHLKTPKHPLQIPLKTLVLSKDRMLS